MERKGKHIMNGGEVLIEIAGKAGMDICFVNAGTTEIPILQAFDASPMAIKPILGLFEGVCTGGADGYGRMLDRPAMTVLHHGPGFANGIANLHNARRAGTPLVNIIGDHATWHQGADAPLAMDIKAVAGSVSAWVKGVKTAEELPRYAAEAISVSLPGRVASLIVPHDILMEECAPGDVPSPKLNLRRVSENSIARAVRRLERGRAALFLGGRALRAEGLRWASRIQAATGCGLFAPSFPPYVERGIGFPDVIKLPYFPEGAIEMMNRYTSVILVGVREPVTFFGYKGIQGRIIDEDREKIFIGGEGEDVVEAMEAIARRLHGKGKGGDNPPVRQGRPEIPMGGLTAEKACRTIAALQPEGAIIVDEGITSTIPYYPLTAGLPPHSLMTIAGGSIGYGMPCATGAALACPDRPVINIQADGSALYTVQALWTQARESLNVTTLICSNRSYHILNVELQRAGVAAVGPLTSSLTNLDRPVVDWLAIARGFGVPGRRTETAEELARELDMALVEPGPRLIEMVL